MSAVGRALGIDIGSVSVSIALVRGDGEVLRSLNTFHRGSVGAALAGLLGELGDERFDASGLTTTHEVSLEGMEELDSVLCNIHAANRLCPDRRGLFIVGGERFHLIRFHEDGSYRDTRSNTSCAAGTGSFLDQQAHRLGLKGAEDLAEMAQTNEGQLPKIASRCSVFAKTDLIHAQQEGYALAEICDGLAAGVARNVVETVVGTSVLSSPTYVAGGVARSPAVVRHLSSLTGLDLKVAPHAEVFGAAGAALLALEQDGAAKVPRDVREMIELLRQPPRRKLYCHEPLLSAFRGGAGGEPGQAGAGGYEVVAPESGVERTLFKGRRTPEGNPVETEVFEPLTGRKLKVHLGVDIGSTSTKAVLVGPEAEVLAGFYTRTAGRPVAAVQALLESICDVERRYECSFEVLSASTTGSGRRLVGAVIGADLVLDEITAHARAATQIDPEVDTIIEIGGQDAKFTTLRDGIVTFSHMNTVCAAGTGSFIEEQAAKLGVGLEEIAMRAAAARAPRTSDRCTVFMERDIHHLLTHGYEVEEILAAVLHSVVENYLHKVATRRMIGSRICFQGATARNEALVAAFAKKLGREVLVSRFCHLAGALGCALTAREEVRGATGFKGLLAWQEDIPVRTEICNLCANACKLRVARVGGQNVVYGCLCGRDYGSRKRAHTRSKAYDGVEARRARYSRESAACPPLPERARELTVGLPFA
ncbi:MAG: acyl-CoA dehydratase activase, partial [Myxococcota bacterium]